MVKSKIAFVIPSLYSGGAERVVSTLSNELVGKYEITIITFTEILPFYELDSRIQVIPCLKTISPSTNRWQGLKNNYLLYRRIMQIVKKNNIKLLIGFMTSTNILTVIAGKTLGIPTIISERIDPTKSQTKTIRKKLRKIVYPKANILVVQTQPILEFFLRWIPKQKLIILPNPLSDSLTEAKKRYSEPKKENIVLNVGRLTKQKGQEMLIRTFAKINPNNWKLQLVGEGSEKAFYKQLIIDLDMENKIELLGLRKDVAELYQKAKIFAFPSLFEGFPNALTEAMHLGLACISTDCPTGPSELIQDGINGYLVPLSDQNAFEEKLASLINNQTLIKEFSNKAPTAVSHLESHNVAKKWDELINKVILR